VFVGITRSGKQEQRFVKTTTTTSNKTDALLYLFYDNDVEKPVDRDGLDRGSKRQCSENMTMVTLLASRE